MEHIDALEAVRRLTLERDALAEQVKRLEADISRMEYRKRQEEGDAPRAPQTCEGCKHAVPGAHAMLCTRHSPNSTGKHGERAHWPVVLKDDHCGDWQAKS